MRNSKVLIGAAVVLALGQANALAQEAVVTSTVEPGAYTDSSIQTEDGSWYGLLREDGERIVWGNGDPNAFDTPGHEEADFMFFIGGYVTYQHSVPMPGDAGVESLTYVVEVSSEYPGANFTWPSNLTVSVNGVPIGTWRIPGDPSALYGAAVQANKLEPNSSQYGWLTQWTVDSAGTWFEAQFRTIPELGLGPISRFKVSEVALSDLGLIAGQPIAITLSVPRPYGAVGHGGLNVYGDTWGDYAVDPTLTVYYHRNVAVDIKPGSSPNAINLGSNGVVPVAILSTTDLDATTIDPETISLAGASVAVRGKGSREMAAYEDVNGDDLLDLVVHVVTTNLRPDLFQDGVAVLRGVMFDGTPVQGQDEIVIVPAD